MISWIVLIAFVIVFLKLLSIVGRKTLLVAGFAPLFILIIFLMSPSCVKNEITDAAKRDTIISTLVEVLSNSDEYLDQE